jgi:hypothetical protein
MITTYSDDFEIFEKSRVFVHSQWLFTLRVPSGVEEKTEEKWRNDGCRDQPVATWLPY